MSQRRGQADLCDRDDANEEAKNSSNRHLPPEGGGKVELGIPEDVLLKHKDQRNEKERHTWALSLPIRSLFL